MISSIRRKVALACVAVLTLALTAVTTTYAWFSMNDAAWVEGFQMDVNATDDLLISADGVNFKQSLSYKDPSDNKNDLIGAINKAREAEGKASITELSEIKLAPVTTTNGKDFSEFLVTYDVWNRQTVNFKTAYENSYVTMKLWFMVEPNSVTLPDYDLHFVTTDSADLKATKFASNDQTLKLVNKLVHTGGEMASGVDITVNPVNALRVAVTNSQTVVYNVGESGLACNETGILGSATADLGGNADAANASTNAMFTYFNNIHNIYDNGGNQVGLAPMEDMGVDEASDFTDKIGEFTYTGTSYNVIELTLALWIEGYDADNLVGLNTANLMVLLTFEARARV